MTDKKYNLSDELKEDVYDRAIKKLDSINNIRNLDENNPIEHALKFNEVKKNPPKSGYMEVKCYEGKDENDNPIIISESKQEDGTIKKLYHNPFFTVDLNTAIMANIAQAPMNVVPMLIDQGQQLVMNEKKEYKPEKRKDEFNWWWIVFILLIIIGVIPLIFAVLAPMLG